VSFADGCEFLQKPQEFYAPVRQNYDFAKKAAKRAAKWHNVIVTPFGRTAITKQSQVFRKV
jgi:hypothetical protein